MPVAVPDQHFDVSIQLLSVPQRDGRYSRLDPVHARLQRQGGRLHERLRQRRCPASACPANVCGNFHKAVICTNYLGAIKTDTTLADPNAGFFRRTMSLREVFWTDRRYRRCDDT